MIRLILLIFICAIFSSPAFACRFHKSDEIASNIIEQAYFIGIVKRTFIRQNEYGLIELMGVEPLTAYKKHQDFEPNKKITFYYKKFTSCNVTLQDGLSEVVIMKRDGRFVLEKLEKVDYKNHLSDLRKNAHYPGE